MNRIAMKTISYLPDHPFKFGRSEEHTSELQSR